MTQRVDLNCDLGEGGPCDEALLDVVTSANIACGFHAGDPGVMHRTIGMALKKGVALGAHPGLRDLEGFGRRAVKVDPQEAFDLTLYQIGALQSFATLHGARALGLEAEIGSLEPGKRADLVLFDLELPEWRPLLDPVSNLVYSASAASVRTVLVDGQIVLDEGRVTTLDEGELMRRVDGLTGPYLARAGLAARPKWPMID